MYVYANNTTIDCIFTSGNSGSLIDSFNRGRLSSPGWTHIMTFYNRDKKTSSNREIIMKSLHCHAHPHKKSLSQSPQTPKKRQVLYIYICWDADIQSRVHKINYGDPTISAPFLTGSPAFHLMGYFFLLCFSMCRRTSKTIFQMTGWGNIKFAHKFEDQIILFHKWM